MGCAELHGGGAGARAAAEDARGLRARGAELRAARREGAAVFPGCAVADGGAARRVQQREMCEGVSVSSAAKKPWMISALTRFSYSTSDVSSFAPVRLKPMRIPACLAVGETVILMTPPVHPYWKTY